MSEKGKITRIEIPLHEYVWLRDFQRLQDSFHGFSTCPGGRPFEPGFVCPHCGSDEPRSTCLEPASKQAEALEAKLMSALAAREVAK